MIGSWEISCVGGSAVRYKLRRKLLSQNFLYSRTLINYLVRNSSIDFNDLVLEIGPGKGFITNELLAASRKVIAVELDPKLVFHLRKYLKNYNVIVTRSGAKRNDYKNLELYQADFLNFQLPKEPYKVFANIPFSIEGEIVRKLLYSVNPPKDCYLIVMKELAIRLSGIPHENQFSLKHKPWFNFSIYHRFKRSDFVPQPKVDSVMWRIVKKEDPQLLWGEKMHWVKFIDIGFAMGTPVKQNLRKILTPEQINYLSGKLNFSLKTKPGYLSLGQWLQIYQIVKALKSPSSRA